MSCLVCGNQVARHFFAASGQMIVQLCKEHRGNYGQLIEITPANPTCPKCSEFGRCCKTRSE